MRKILLLLILLCPVLLLWGKDKHKPKHMPPGGRWVEIKRQKPDSTEVAFTDTMFMTFRLRDSFTYNTRNGFIYKGKYTYDEDDHLDFGTVSYTVALKKPNTLIFANPNGISYFTPDTSDTAQVIVLSKEDSVLPVTSIDQMIGHWTVYKRTVSKEGITVDFDKEIKSAYITGPGTSPDKQGYLYCGKDGASNPSWYIRSLTPDQALDVNGKNLRTIKVVKCQKGEMILEENNVKYYFKQFK